MRFLFPRTTGENRGMPRRTPVRARTAAIPTTP
jgi:hypothetical protein